MMNRLLTTWASVLLLTLLPHPAMAQLKPLTLEDLNYGGKNYRQMSPANETYVWWGDQLVKTDHRVCEQVSIKDLSHTSLFTLDDVNTTLAEGERLHSLIGATFPYSDSTIAVIDGPKERLLYDWKKKAVIWKQSSAYNVNDWSPVSRALAYVDGNQLFVAHCDGHVTQLSKDGSREIVYGQSVHRDEFGIYKGTFWSPDGQHLAFYRMDQSMVTDYPQVNTSTRIATYEPRSEERRVGKEC